MDVCSLPNDELSGTWVSLEQQIMPDLSGTNKNDFKGDVPFLHPFYNDWEFYIAPDPQYIRLLAFSTATYHQGWLVPTGFPTCTKLGITSAWSPRS